MAGAYTGGATPLQSCCLPRPSSCDLNEVIVQIRHYATEDRKGLSNTSSENWPAAFSKVGDPKQVQHSCYTLMQL